MTIPKFNELFNKVLEDLSDGQEWRAKDFYEHVIDSLNLPEAERSEKLGGGNNRAISRAYFACEYLFQARAISRPKRGHVQITDFGRQILAEHPRASRSLSLRRLKDLRIGLVELPNGLWTRRGSPEKVIR